MEAGEPKRVDWSDVLNTGVVTQNWSGNFDVIDGSVP